VSADANSTAYDRMVASHPWLVGVRPASEVVPGMQRNLILHAAPATTWANMADLVRGGMIGAALFEGLADTPDAAIRKAAAGEIRFGAAQDHGAMAGGAGAIAASLPVMVVEDRSNGNRSAHFLMEGFGRALAFGAYEPPVLDRLRWLRDTVAPILDRAIQALGGIDLRAVIAEALLRGDELHNRNKAATSLFFEHIAMGLLEVNPPLEEHRRILRFLHENFQFFVCAVLPAAQLMLRAADGIAGSGVVTGIGGNGNECGIRLSGLGDRWFTAPGDVPKGVLQPGMALEDVAPGCGDSFLVECAGLGASVLPAAPALAPALGCAPADGLRISDAAYRIALGEHPHYRIPALDFRGAPVGVDARKVVDTGILPTIDIVMCHRKAGGGLMGMGVVSPPMACFQQAVRELRPVSR
jgi:uncharacterized protein DUF1116